MTKLSFCCDIVINTYRDTGIIRWQHRDELLKCIFNLVFYFTCSPDEMFTSCFGGACFLAHLSKAQGELLWSHSVRRPASVRPASGVRRPASVHIFKRLLLRNYMSDLNQIWSQVSVRRGNELLLKLSGFSYSPCCHVNQVHIFKIFFSKSSEILP